MTDDTARAVCNHGEVETYVGRGARCRKCGEWALFKSAIYANPAGLREDEETVATIRVLMASREGMKDDVPIWSDKAMRAVLALLAAPVAVDVERYEMCGACFHPMHVAPCRLSVRLTTDEEGFCYCIASEATWKDAGT